MATPPIDYILASDTACALSARNHLSKHMPGICRMAGSWTELMAQVKSAYLLTSRTDEWTPRLMTAAEQDQNAFWASSLKIAPRETLAEIDTALKRLIVSGGPNADWQGLMKKNDTHTRLFRRLTDLSRLFKNIGKLPIPIHVMADYLACTDSPIKTIRVYFDETSCALNPFQLAVLEKLSKDAPSLDPDLLSLYKNAIAPAPTTRAALKSVRRLFNPTDKPPKDLKGVRFLAARDSLEEAEIVAGMIQKTLSNGTAPEDVGIIVPDNALSLKYIEDVFQKCGLMLSGCTRTVGIRDIGCETVRNFLLCLRKPAPIMAIAALITSPLFPWSIEEGIDMSKAVMGGDVLLKSPQTPPIATKVMNQLDQGVATPSKLSKALSNFTALLSDKVCDHTHLSRARDITTQLQSALSGIKKFDWDKLFYIANPHPIQESIPAQYYKGSIAVFHEGFRPWRTVRHLFVLGFNDGHYPAAGRASAVFTEDEWQQIDDLGWPVMTNKRFNQQQRDTFVAQLSSVSQSITFLLSQRDAGGKTLSPSSSMAFLSRSLGIEIEDIVLDLDRPDDVEKLSDLPLADETLPISPPPLKISDLSLKTDLLAVFGKTKGELAPLSPSAAETLMVSPFAWLLRRLDCEPSEWYVDDLDVMTAGSLAHRVFEQIFQPGKLPTDAEIEAMLPGILQTRTLQLVPFLRSPDWRVERMKFEAEMLRATKRWRQLLYDCHAKIVSAEQWLRGKYKDIPLHGQSDLLLELPSKKLLVVDYKKTTSRKRRDRMSKGFDLQAHLYRLMIQSGGLPDLPSKPKNIGVVYYMLNDTTALADSPVGTTGAPPGWEIIADDVAAQAMQHLDRRLTQIRKGKVKLNTTADEKWWSDNASIPIYALDNSPLLRLFMHEAEDN